MTNLSDLVEVLAKQAMGGQQTQAQNTGAGGLGGILGSVLGQMTNQGSNASAQSGLGGMLGSVLGQLGGGSSTNNSNANSGAGMSTLLVAVLPMVLAWIQQQGGLQGALSKLQQAGLGAQAQSWVNPATAQNQTVQGQQIQALFNDADIALVAAQTNTSTQNIYAAIAGALPQVIDSLTPKGEQTSHQEADLDIQNVLGTLSGLLK